jgi:hypothetical protein
MRGVKKEALIQPSKVLAAVGAEVFEVGFLSRIAFGFTGKAGQKPCSVQPLSSVINLRDELRCGSWLPTQESC